MTSQCPQQRPRRRRRRRTRRAAGLVALLSTITIVVCGVLPLTASFSVGAPRSISSSSRRRAAASRLVRQAGDGSDESDLFASPPSPVVAVNPPSTNATTTALFSTVPSSATATTAGFGDVVRPRYLEKTDSAILATSGALGSTTNTDDQQVADKLRKRNFVVALCSVGVALLNYAWQFTHPLSPVQLLVNMQAASAAPTVIGRNGKPTVVDFWAPWCENCKLTASTLHAVEEEYKESVNFVMVDGDKRASGDLIEAFGVDAIPHLALVSAEGDVMTALIGPIPKTVLEADLDVLISNAQLKDQALAQAIPYRMMDVFAGNPAGRRVQFDP